MTRPTDSSRGQARYRIEHVSRFGYSAPVRRCTMSLCLRPLESPRQRLLDFSVETTPPVRFTTETDPFGNIRHVLTLHREHDRLEVVSTSAVEVDPPPSLPDRLETGAWDEVRSMGNDPRWWDFTGHSPLARPSPALGEFVTELGVEPGADPLVDVLALSAALNDAFSYTTGTTSVDSPIDDILVSRKGVCQDYTHVLVAVARSWGIPTRYVSGYLYVTENGVGEAPDLGRRTKHGDAELAAVRTDHRLANPRESQRSASGAATHAWAETRLPGAGWIGIDPTNRRLADQRYVRIAAGRDYGDVPPTKGVIEGGGNSRLEVDVRMTLLSDSG